MSMEVNEFHMNINIIILLAKKRKYFFTVSHFSLELMNAPRHKREIKEVAAASISSRSAVFLLKSKNFLKIFLKILLTVAGQPLSFSEISCAVKYSAVFKKVIWQPTHSKTCFW